MKVKIKWSDIVGQLNPYKLPTEFIVEAEPIEEGPEWIQEYEDRQIGESPDHIIQDFIRHEVIEKICEEIAGNLRQAESEVCWTPKSSDIVKDIKARWLGRDK